MNQTQRVLGVLYMILYMIVAIIAIIYFRTMYRDGNDASLRNTLIAVLVVTTLSMFALIK